jgi:hypothetical protein
VKISKLKETLEKISETQKIFFPENLTGVKQKFSNIAKAP